MTMGLKLRIFCRAGFRRIVSSFLQAFGLLWLILEPAGLFWPERLHLGWRGYVWLAMLSLAGAAILRWPRLSLSRRLSGSDSEIEIKVGDLLEESGHLVIGTNDVFDTEPGDIIKPSSVQGQFLERVYNGDRRRLDTDIATALDRHINEKRDDSDKTIGKSSRYPIGTIVVLGLGDRRYFLVAYGRMGNDLKCRSDADDIWKSLGNLWAEVGRKGQGTQIAIPVLGSDLARTNLPRTLLIELIAISFIVACRQGFVVNKLTVVIHPKDIDRVNMYELKEFLTSACI